MTKRFPAVPAVFAVALLFVLGPGSRPAAAQAGVSIVKAGAPDPVPAGASLTYTITATVTGVDLEDATVTDPLPAGTTFVSLAAPGGWSCSTPAVGSAGTVSCSEAPMPAGSAVFTLVVRVSSALAGGTVLTNQVDFAATSGGRTTTTTGSATTQVVAPTVVSATKTYGGLLTPGSTVIYTVIATNTSAYNQGDNPGPEFTDVLPASLALLSAMANTGTITATTLTNTVTWNGTIPAGSLVTITIQAKVNAPVGTIISNQGTVFYDSSGNGVNQASAPTDDPFKNGTADPTVFTVQSEDFPGLPALDPVGLVAFALLLALAGGGLLRRRARV